LIGWAKIKQASEYAGVSPRTLRDWLKQGLPHSRLPTGTILIKLTSIDAWLESFAVGENQVDRIVEEICQDINRA
jgi:excisionase family DNA binding protein